MPRYVQMDDWIFEVKAVRAIKVGKYGDPYSAISNLNVTGDSMYIDGQMHRQGEQFSRKDFSTFYNFCQQLGMKSAQFDRIKQGQRLTKTIEIQQPLAQDSIEPTIRLVK